MRIYQFIPSAVMKSRLLFSVSLSPLRRYGPNCLALQSIYFQERFSRRPVYQAPLHFRFRLPFLTSSKSLTMQSKQEKVNIQIALTMRQNAKCHVLYLYTRVR